MEFIMGTVGALGIILIVIWLLSLRKSLRKDINDSSEALQRDKRLKTQLEELEQNDRERKP